jgi:transposase
MKQIKRIGIDLAKSVFQVHGVDAHENVVLRRQVTRAKLRAFFAQCPPCQIGMEAWRRHYGLGLASWGTRCA